jgi:hypothetical protein
VRLWATSSACGGRGVSNLLLVSRDALHPQRRRPVPLLPLLQ